MGDVFEDGALIEYEVTAPKKAWDVLSDVLKEHGGLISVHREDGLNHIDWKSEDTRPTNSQPLRVGVNILSLKLSVSGERLATVIYGYGKKTDGVYLRPAEANGGLNYIKDDEAVDAFGYIAEPYVDTSAETAEDLLKGMRIALNERLEEARTIQAEAVDLYDIGWAQEPLDAGQKALLIVPTMDIEEYVPVTKIRRYLFQPRKTEITFGASLNAVSRIMLRR